MSDDAVPSTEPYDPDLDPDTDATMTAPEEGRPDGVPPENESEASAQDEPAVGE
jgi:hypothetical protein